MTPKRQRRLLLIIFILASVTAAVALVLYALKQNINLFYSPSEIIANRAPHHHVIRLGGLVKPHSIIKDSKKLNVQFTVTDKVNDVIVKYHGVLPNLFRAGQGIVVEGHLISNNMVVADQVLAKHDAKYMPPAVKKTLEKAKKTRRQHAS